MEQTKEIWKEIPKYNGKYLISNLGNVKRRVLNKNDGSLTSEEKKINIRKGGFTTYYNGEFGYENVSELLNQLFNIGIKSKYKYEEWKVIKGFDGKYLISNLGRVKLLSYYKSSGERVRDRILKERNGNVVLITSQGEHKTASIAQLLYEYFKIGKIDNLQGEIWKDIKTYEGIYQVSNMGRVKRLNCSTKTLNGKIQNNLTKLITHDIGKNGYHRVPLQKDKKTKKYLVSRLVAEAFIPNPNNYPCVDHIDTNKDNNCASNLKWCTHKQNMANPLTVQKNIASHINQKGHEVILYNKKEKDLKYFPSISELSRQSVDIFGYPISRDRIRKCIKNKKEIDGYYFVNNQ